jgi:hypothetical protein
MKRFVRRVQGGLDAIIICFKAIAHLSIYCGTLIYSRKLQVLREIARDVRDLLIWRSNCALPEVDFYLARNKIWLRVNEEYHQGTWEKTKDLLQLIIE